MTFLIKAALDWLWGKLANFIGALIAKFINRAEVKKDESASVDPLKNAKTAQEIEDATKSALDGL